MALRSGAGAHRPAVEVRHEHRLRVVGYVEQSHYLERVLAIWAKCWLRDEHTGAGLVTEQAHMHHYRSEPPARCTMQERLVP